PTSSLASPIFPPRVCTNCCPGNGSACAKPTCPPISSPPEPLAPHHKPASAPRPRQSRGLARVSTIGPLSFDGGDCGVGERHRTLPDLALRILQPTGEEA